MSSVASQKQQNFADRKVFSVDEPSETDSQLKTRSEEWTRTRREERELVFMIKLIAS